MAYGVASQEGGILSLPYPAKIAQLPSATPTSTTFLVSQLVKYSAANTVAITASVTDVAIGIICDVSNYLNRHNLGTTSDRTISFCPAQFQPMWVWSNTAATYDLGAKVYMAQTAGENGESDDDSAASATTVGQYFWDQNGKPANLSTLSAADTIGILFTGNTW